MSPAAQQFIKQMDTDPRAASQILSSAIEKNPKDARLRSVLAATQLLQGDQTAAQDTARQALALDPNDTLARMILGHPDEFARAQNKLSGIKWPMDGKALPDLAGGDGAVRAGPIDPAARAAAEKALAALAAGVGPGADLRTQAQLLLKSAVDKLSMGDLNGALFDVSRALLDDPGSVNALILRSHISNLPKNHNYEAAVLDADKALKLDPKSAAALFEKGYALLQLGKVSESLRLIEDGLALAPDNAMGRFYHALALEKAGLIAKAVEEYRRAAALDPALRPLVDEALARIADLQTSMPRSRLPRAIPTKYILWIILGVTALALLLEGGKRVFYKDWKTTVLAKPEAELPKTATGTLAPGTVLGGNFRIEREIARGGIGIVYQATDLTLKRTVAIKHLNREAYESGEVRERFLKEAQLAAKLKHPNLAQIYSVVGDGELYLVFEYVEGETLHARLARQRRLAIDEVRAVVKDVAAAVDYAHSQKIIHRDLKPANLMVGPDGRCKVLDFGIAHEARSVEATRTQAWGTPPYMAPEQELGSVSKESDLYALGVIVYELLAGERPFQGGSMLELKLNMRFRPIIQANPDVPEGLHAFFQKALDSEPAKRFHSAQELVRALDAAARSG
ncbi:MAG: protein kinase [Elusimicrobia bacterium]|nr:protein kinase [Elusimicrobiota bacterium]